MVLKWVGGSTCWQSQGQQPLLCPADPAQDTKLELDGQQVVVPQGRPVPCPQFSSSHFSQSEYLIYKESQCCLRYLLQLRL